MINLDKIEKKTRAQLDIQKQIASNVIDLSTLAIRLGNEYNVHPKHVMKLMLQNLEEDLTK